MSSRAELLAKRERLLVRSAELRISIAQDAQSLRKPLALVDQGRDGVNWLRAHPQVLIGAAFVLAILRPRRAVALAKRAWWGFGVYRRAMPWLTRLRQL
jgi:hypothetical protein